MHISLCFISETTAVASNTFLLADLARILSAVEVNRENYFQKVKPYHDRYCIAAFLRDPLFTVTVDDEDAAVIILWESKYVSKQKIEEAGTTSLIIYKHYFHTFFVTSTDRVSKSERLKWCCLMCLVGSGRPCTSHAAWEGLMVVLVSALAFRTDLYQKAVVIA